MNTATVGDGRLFLVVAAVLWSSSSLFMRMLQQPTLLGVPNTELSPVQIAFFRALFAGLCLIPLVPASAVRFRPRMAAAAATFAVMNGLYLSALGSGSAANAILLQNTAPVWVYICSVWILGRPADPRVFVATLIGLLGAVVIVGGNWPMAATTQADAEILVLLMGLGSGLTYAGVVLFLGSMTSESPVWLTLINLLGTALITGGWVLFRFGPSAMVDWLTAPTLGQFVVLVVFGVVQLATPYVLFARSLRTVSPAEAGVITLLEPVLNPVWAYLMSPERDTPTVWTWLGGGLLLGALVWQYVPRKRTTDG
jgi:drug/metabolite transporter, DME family